MLRSVTTFTLLMMCTTSVWAQFGGGGFGGGGPAVPAAVGGKAIQGPSQKLLNALEAPVDYDIVDMPLEDVARLVQMQLEVPVLLDQTSLDDEGIDRQQPLSFSLSGNSTTTVLDLMLEPVNLGYICRGDVLQITSRSVADEAFYVQMLDISNLLEQSDSGPDAEQLQNLIYSSIPDAYWADHDGEGGQLQVIGSVLVVTHNMRAQQSVKALLDGLQQIQATQQPGTDTLSVKAYRVTVQSEPSPLSLNVLGAAVTPAPATEQAPVDLEALPRKLTDIIRSSIEPGSWGLESDAGQPTLWAVPGAVVVRANAATHAQVRTFLKPFSPQEPFQGLGNPGYVPGGGFGGGLGGFGAGGGGIFGFPPAAN